MSEEIKIEIIVTKGQRKGSMVFPFTDENYTSKHIQKLLSAIAACVEHAKGIRGKENE